MGCQSSKPAGEPKADKTLIAAPGAVYDATKPSGPPNPIRIGATIPNFDLKTTKGDFKLHEWLNGSAEKPWTIMFSHPKDYTPVCTTELGACHSLNERFEKEGCKLLGISCDSIEEHNGWSKDVLAREKSSDESLAFPIVADADRSIVTKLGMLDPEEKDAAGVPLPARALVILHGTTVKLMILYPATTGRNFEEVFRTVTSLQLTAGQGLATPVNWSYGERVIVGPAVKTEDAQTKFEDLKIETTLPSGKEYLRSVKCPELSKVPLPTANAAVPKETGVNPLRIGATIPNFEVKSTKGDFKLHDWLNGDKEKPWTVLFSHPKDYTPVCTTELGACHGLSGRFEKIGCKLIGISCDSVEEHHGWSKDVLFRERPSYAPDSACPQVKHREDKAADESLAFPLIADADRTMVTALGMLDPEEKDAAGVPLPARALVILQGTTVKLTILYPATTGRNFEEVFRVITSLQLTAGQGLATPVNWKYGERVIVGPPVKTEDAKAKFEDFQMETLPSGKEYLRSVKCPAGGLLSP
jgi:1-Cys peroxiredoxin 6